MKVKIIVFLSLIISSLSFSEEKINIEKKEEILKKAIDVNYSVVQKPVTEIVTDIMSLYDSLKIKDKLSYEIFKKAYLGYIQIPNKNPGILIIIDYSRPSNEERFFVINLDKKQLVYHTRVAHSKNSGLEIPFQFSDNPNSYESSLGFFITLGEYNGAYGHSLRLKGLEENVNSNAEDRAIVIHGGEIVEDSYIKKYGFAGRSLGCPVLPNSITKEVIEYIRNGRVLFVYGEDDEYLEESTYLKKYIPILENENSINLPVKVEDAKIDINKEVSTINQNEIVKDKKDIKEETIISIDNSNKLENINIQDYKQETPKETVLDEKTAREKVLEYENKIKSNEEKEEKIAEKKEVSNKKDNYRKALGLKIKK